MILSRIKPITLSYLKDYELIDILHQRINVLESKNNNMGYEEVKYYGLGYLRARF